MNLSEKLAAADGTPAPHGRRGAGRTRAQQRGRRRRGEAGDRRGPPGGVERRGTGTSPGPGKHPLRRASDRPALDEAWKQSKQKVQAKVLAEIAPTSADLSPDELREKVALLGQRDPRT